MADDLQRSALYLQLNQAGKLSDRSLLEDMDWDAVKEREYISTEQKRVLESQRSQAMAQAGIQGEAQLVQIKYQGRAQKIMAELQAAAMPPQAAAAMQEGGQMAAGQPGIVSPSAGGNMVNQQTAQMNQQGMVPPMDTSQMQAPAGGEQQLPEQAPATQAGESLLSPDQGAGQGVGMVAQQVVSYLNQLPEHEKQHELTQMQQNNPQLFGLVLQMLHQTAGADANSAAAPMPEQRPPMRGPEAVTL